MFSYKFVINIHHQHQQCFILNRYKAGQPVVGLLKVKSDMTANGVCTLSVTNVQTSDAGLYTIEAKNDYGSVSSSASLIIISGSSGCLVLL